MNTRIGLITVERFLNESLPEGVFVFVETYKGLKEIDGIIKHTNGTYSAHIKTAKSRGGLIPVGLSDSLFLAFEDITEHYTPAAVKSFAYAAALPDCFDIMSESCPEQYEPNVSHWLG